MTAELIKLLLYLSCKVAQPISDSGCIYTREQAANMQQTLLITHSRHCPATALGTKISQNFQIYDEIKSPNLNIYTVCKCQYFTQNLQVHHREAPDCVGDH